MAGALGASADSRFEVRLPLGSGGMGTVYRAFDHRVGREVALKILRHVTGRDLYRFKREFRLLADMAHPNLVALHELHTSGDEWFFTMELVEGVSFLEWVRPGRAFTAPATDSDPTAVDVVEGGVEGVPAAAPPLRVQAAITNLDEDRLRAALPQLVEGVLALHVAGKLHRDLKPSNVLVTRDGRVVLLDFGLVSDVQTMVAERTHEAAAVGTPAYMSPEQAADDALTDASDWYAVGVMLYEALTGRRPFAGSAEALMRRKQQELPPSPRELMPNVPLDLDRLCMQLLERRPERRPDGRAVVASLQSELSPAFSTLERMVAARPFVGRSHELAALRSAYEDAAEHTVALFVSGESGIGKSQLVRRFLDEIATQALVVEGRCYERESVPYKALDTVIDALTGILLGMPEARVREIIPRDVPTLARVFPVLRRVGAIAERAVAALMPTAPLELRTRAFSALRTLLRRLAAEAPVVIALDDLQWGDADSAIFLADLVHDLEPLPLLLVLIHRPEDDAGVVERVRAPRPGLASGDLRTLALGPLSEGDARLLIRAVGGGDSTGDSLIRDAGGHPLFLAELARTADRGRDAPASFAALVAARLAGLSPASAALTRIAAVAARPLPVDLAASAAAVVLDGSEIPVLRAERLLRARRLGEHDVEHVETYHDRVRAAVVAALTPDELIAAHTALAHAYEAAGRRQDLEAIVGHWMSAGEPGRAAVRAVEAARVAAETMAFHRAAALYALALAHGVADETTRRQLQRRQGEALADAGRGVEAAAAFVEAARGADPDQVFELDQLRLAQLLKRGLLEEGHELSRRLLAPLGIGFPATRSAAIRAMLFQVIRKRLRGVRFVERDEAEVPPETLRRIDLLFTAATALGVADPIMGLTVQSHCMREALDAGEPNRICMVLAIDLGYRAQKGTYQQRHIQEAVTVVRDLSSRVSNPRARGIGTIMQGFLDFQLGRHQEALPMIEAGLGLLRDNASGLRWEISVNEQVHVSILFYLGEAREVVKLVPRFLRDAIDRGDTYAQDGMRGWRGNVAWLFMGKPDEARANVTAIQHPLPSPDQAAIRHLNELISQLQIDLYEGKVAEARARLDVTWPVLASSFLFRVQLLRVEGHLIRGRVLLAQAMTSDGAARERVLAELKPSLKALSTDRAPWGLAIAELFRALAARARGDLPAAAARLELAERALTGVDMRLFAEVVRLRRGQLEGGPTGEARASAALAAMVDQGIADPPAIARMLCPWPA